MIRLPYALKSGVFTYARNDCFRIAVPFPCKRGSCATRRRITMMRSVDMTSYILKRIGSALITLFVVAAATFFLMNAVPGSPFITEK